MARTFGDHGARVILAHMAQAWLRVADNCQDVKKVRPRHAAATADSAQGQRQERLARLSWAASSFAPRLILICRGALGHRLR